MLKDELNNHIIEFKKKEYKKSYNGFKEIINRTYEQQVVPTLAYAYFYLGLLSLLGFNNENDNAVKYFDKAINNKCIMHLFNNYALYFRLGYHFDKNEEYAKILESYVILNYDMLEAKFIRDNYLFIDSCDSYDDCITLVEEYDNDKYNYDLAVMIYNGMNMDYNCIEAIKHFEKYADEYQPERMFKIAQYLDNEKEYKLALDYYKNASLNLNQEASLRLGEMYYQGLGCTQNMTIAEKYFTRAFNQNFKYFYNSEKKDLSLDDIIFVLTEYAKRGYIEAYRLLGEEFYEGKHGFRNKNLAEFYFNKYIHYSEIKEGQHSLTSDVSDFYRDNKDDENVKNTILLWIMKNGVCPFDDINNDLDIKDKLKSYTKKDVGDIYEEYSKVCKAISDLNEYDITNKKGGK